MLDNGLRITAIAGLAAITLAGCTTTVPGGRPAASGGETGAMAATFRYMFANNASAARSNVASYCIGTGTAPALTDPDPELLAALSDVRPKVVPASACKAGVRAVDASGQPVLIFNLRTVQCDGLDNCLFQGGYYEGNISASGGNYRARWIDGKWQIVPEGPQAIS